MRVKIRRFYSLDVEKTFQLWTEVEKQREWMRLPDWMKLEVIEDENGNHIGAAASCKKNGKWVTTKSKNIYYDKNNETRCLITEVTDEDGNDLLNHECSPCKSIAFRNIFVRKDNGTELAVEYHLDPKNIFRAWDALWLLPEFKKRTNFLMDLLDDFVSNQNNNAPNKAN